MEDGSYLFAMLWETKLNLPQGKKSMKEKSHSFVSLCSRKMVDERTRQVMEQSKEKARQESDRLESKRQASEKVCKKERDRQEKAETWKHSRIEAMKDRRAQHEEMENSYERAAQEYESQRLVRDEHTLLWRFEVSRSEGSSRTQLGK